jgi:exopolysaccharide biosynthesis WecB/TagA/CpsF family protein
MTEALRVGRHQRVRIGGLPIDALTLEETAAQLIDEAVARQAADRPFFYSTSANGQVLSLCATDAHLDALMRNADQISADGMSLVIFARWFGRARLPERVATTDLFEAVARRAELSGISMYLLGGSAEANQRAIARVAARYPHLKIAGGHHGFLSPEDAGRVVSEIRRLAPGILWIAMGVPREQQFVAEHRDALGGVGAVKTAGGLFDFLAGTARRAPAWMQYCGLEWLYRAWREPKRLSRRYLTTNPHALWLMLTRSGGSD